MRYFKNPRRGMALTAFAGPASNVLIAIVFLFLYGLFYRPLSTNATGLYFLRMIDLTAVISLGLAIFNILPFPPLDGSKILFSFLSDEGYRLVLRYERYGSLVLFALVSLGVLGKPLTALINAAWTALLPVAHAAFDLTVKLFYR
jgi:Zn-dependent protease